MPSIHPLAVVSPTAQIADDVEIGPFSVVETEAVLGEGCRLASHVVVREKTVLGRHNRVGEAAILGGEPQHLKCPAETGRLVIGDGNVIREHATMHRSLKSEGETRIGDGGMFMTGSHVAHDCQVGNRVILTSNVMLAGHVEVGDGAVFGGAAAVHQFCRIGRLAMIGGMARVRQDVPPFVTLDGGTEMIVGLNRIGLRRAGIPRDQIARLKAAYKVIYRRGLYHEEMIAALRETFPFGPASEFAPFFASGTRGFHQERRPPPGATVRIFRDDVDAPGEQRHAG